MSIILVGEEGKVIKRGEGVDIEKGRGTVLETFHDETKKQKTLTGGSRNTKKHDIIPRNSRILEKFQAVGGFTVTSAYFDHLVEAGPRSTQPSVEECNLFLFMILHFRILRNRARESSAHPYYNRRDIYSFGNRELDLREMSYSIVRNVSTSST